MVTTKQVEPGHGQGATLLEAAEAEGADLLVMGAYGHSRLREIVLGGATREVYAARGCRSCSAAESVRRDSPNSAIARSASGIDPVPGGQGKAQQGERTWSQRAGAACSCSRSWSMVVAGAKPRTKWATRTIPARRRHGSRRDRLEDQDQSC